MGQNCHDHKHIEIPSYWHSLDGDSYKNSINRFSAKNLSVSTPPFENQLNALRARIKLGVNNIELGFTGVGKGSAQSPTPGSVGMAERQAIKEVAKINDVNIASVHAPMSIQGLAGYDQRSFNENKRAQDVEEVKRSINFAGDVSNGGAIVVHTGEFPYSIKERFGDKPFITKDGKKIKLQESPYASEFSKELIVDREGNITGESLGKNDFISVYDKTSGEFQSRDIDYYRNEAVKNKNKNKKEENIKKYKEVTNQDISDSRYKETYENPYWLANLDKLDVELIRYGTEDSEFAYKEFQKENRKNEMQNAIRAAEQNNETELAENIKKLYERYDSDDFRDDWYALQGKIKDAKRQRLLSSSLGDYGIKRTNESVAELAIEAAKITKDKKLDKPLFIAPENLWDGNYGSHPQDLKKIIKDSRNQFVEFATKDKIIINGNEVDNSFKKQIEKIHGKKLSIDDAKKYAKDHIKATFDIGHANIWRKYFDGSDEEFKQWLGTEVKDLTDNGIIGHVHVSDNFGYNDEHLAPGSGNAPIKEFMTHLEKSNFKGEVVFEPGSGNTQDILSGMYDLETPVYRLHGDRTESWTSIQGGYFGQGYIPSFVTNSYLSPADKNRPFTWSGVPLE